MFRFLCDCDLRFAIHCDSAKQNKSREIFSFKNNKSSVTELVSSQAFLQGETSWNTTCASAQSFYIQLLRDLGLDLSAIMVWAVKLRNAWQTEHVLQNGEKINTPLLASLCEVDHLEYKGGVRK
jgi:hypothetical protein